MVTNIAQTPSTESPYFTCDICGYSSNCKSCHLTARQGSQCVCNSAGEMDIARGECYDIRVEADSDAAKRLYEIENAIEESSKKVAKEMPWHKPPKKYHTHVISDLVETLPMEQLDLFARHKPGAMVSTALFSVQYQRMKLETSLRNHSSYSFYRKMDLQKPHPLSHEIV